MSPISNMKLAKLNHDIESAYKYCKLHLDLINSMVNGNHEIATQKQIEPFQT